MTCAHKKLPFISASVMMLNAVLLPRLPAVLNLRL